MSVVLRTIGVIVQDMATTLAFYRALGLPIPDGGESEDNLDIPLDSGITLGFLTQAMAKQADPNYSSPLGSSLNLQFECSSSQEVDTIFHKLTAAGYKSHAEPWDAFWGQPFARITDPDGRIVNLYAPL